MNKKIEIGLLSASLALGGVGFILGCVSTTHTAEPIGGHYSLVKKEVEKEYGNGKNAVIRFVRTIQKTDKLELYEFEKFDKEATVDSIWITTIRGAYKDGKTRVWWLS